MSSSIDKSKIINAINETDDERILLIIQTKTLHGPIRAH